MRPLAADATAFDDERRSGRRFGFGENWARFLAEVNDARIEAAESSLRDLIGEPLRGRAFLDIGSGSGLFSLAALRLGARAVRSFDYDPESVACAEQLRSRFGIDPAAWRIERGSILDAAYTEGLGLWDVVYSWGVLHHTGRMWEAIDAATERVAPGGRFALAIYNDQGAVSAAWRRVKRLYNTSALGRAIVCAVFFPYFALTGLAGDVVAGRDPRGRYRQTSVRGMSLVRDWHDWLGGLPFEVAKPEAVFEFVRQRGFELVRLRTCGGRLGCNEFVFRRRGLDGAPAPR